MRSNLKSQFIGVIVLYLLISSLASRARADYLDNLSNLGPSCTSRTTVSGVVDIPIRVSNASYQVSTRILQYDAMGAQFIYDNQVLGLTGTGTDLYTLKLDTGRLMNGWANVDIYSADSGLSFSVYLWIMGSGNQAGEPFSIVSGNGADDGGGGVTPQPTATPVASPTPISSPTPKPCRAKRCR